MPQNTRSRRQGLRPAAPLPCRQTRRHKASRGSTQEINPNQGEMGLRRELSHTTAIFSLPGSSPEHSEYETEASPTPTPTHSCGLSTSSKRPGQIESSTDNSSHELSFHSAPEPAAPWEAEHQPEHVEIIHFDFSKYKPSTPGSKSHPIKIEDSPNASSLSLIRTLKTYIHQGPLSPLPKESATQQYDYQSDDPSRVDNDPTGGSSFMIFPEDLVLSEGVTSVITSPKAATRFLHCFLASEKYWLKSLDHDMDPDVRFWKTIVERFNADPLECSISKWQTARAIATTLCSQPYKTQVEQQLPGVNDELSNLISAIQDCRRMSQRRRWGQRSSFENMKTRIRGVAVIHDTQKCVLGRKPQTLEDQKKLLQTLATACAESTQPTVSKIDEPKAGPSLSNRNKQQGTPLQPHAAGSSTRNHNIVSTEWRGNNPGEIKRNTSKRFKIWGKGNNRPPEGYPYPPMGRRKGVWREDPSLSRHTGRDEDNNHLEQRVRELERTIEALKRPRYSY
ncbi:hypothetical protein F4859DRAFT_518554 [Xylaria cf. heliscus]|nr:hypothetical protein F4859DRAFT_518554 [Xylaria cf. heliscus]